MSKRETKTDETTVDLGTILESDHTATYDPAALEGHLAGRPGTAVEANIILIAHPEDEVLGTRYRLPPHGTLEIGRSSGSDISMPDVRSLSRNHARLRHLGDMVEVEDLGSTNGTYVNDQPLTLPRPLRSGDRFQVGAVHFKFLHEKDPEHAYHEAIYQLVVCDGLTQVFNKRKLDEELAREFGRAQRHKRPLSMMLFDLDHFKDVNDSYGHLCGDFVLQQIARLTEEYLRAEQILARVGGEEFVVLSPEMTVTDTSTLAEKMRQRFADETYHYADVEVRISCSFGIAGLDPDMRHPSELFDAADRAMYHSKNAGRDRVTIYASGM